MNNSFEKKIRANRTRRARQLRRHLIISAFAFFAIIAISLGFFSIKAKADSKTSIHTYKYYKSLTVNADDSLWEYALLYAPDDNYDKYIKEVIRMNNLNDDNIITGMSIILPYYSDEFLY